MTPSDCFQDDHSKVMVFFDTKRRADDLERRLAHRWRVLCIHGDKLQQQRDQVMQDFKRGSGRILLATDVAARGLGECGFQQELIMNPDFAIKWVFAQVSVLVLIKTVKNTWYWMLVKSMRAHFQTCPTWRR